VGGAYVIGAGYVCRSKCAPPVPQRDRDRWGKLQRDRGVHLPRVFDETDLHEASARLRVEFRLGAEIRARVVEDFNGVNRHNGCLLVVLR
jgi:hypothetical protein